MSETSPWPDYELPASFYLGKKYDLEQRQLLEEKLLYDAKDLTTHAMCVGMTGSGKTGLCLALLEEAAIDGIPAICIDPKGDLGNLLLTFPELKPDDFEPWIEPSDASRKGLSPQEYASQTASTWRKGLQAWDQSPARIQLLRDSAEVSIYTPASNAGLPLTVMKSFDAPPPEVIEDGELFRERISGTVSGLLTLMGIQYDPLTSREFILVSNILDHAWRHGQNLDLPALIRSIQSPPMDKVGVFDMESFFPSSDRMKMAMALNNLLASPSFAGWLEGQPLDIKRLLYTSHGKPRVSIISIAHLSDSERMFFVTILLNELLSWMRVQPGTSSLRALFYMDEVYGYFPPTAKPPSKTPMMILLKQARAFGLGIVLATQNPVDLDYKGLANIGTWFLGRLQTQRDKDRVIDGLEGAAAQTGSRFDRQLMNQTLSSLGSRVFLMNNVHDDGPTIFQSRWAMSFLRGPLSRTQIQQLTAAKRQQEIADKSAEHQSGDLASGTASEITAAANNAAGSAEQSSGFSAARVTDGPSSVSPPNLSSNSMANNRPIVGHSVTEKFIVCDLPVRSSEQLVYRPALLAHAACRIVHGPSKLDEYFEKYLFYSVGKEIPSNPWRDAAELQLTELELADHPEPNFLFEQPPGPLLNEKFYRQWAKDLADELYRNRPARVFHSKELKKTSRPGEDEIDARVSWTQEIRELRDVAKADLQQKYSKQLQMLESRIRTAQQRMERQQAQYDKEKWNTIMNVGSTVLGRLLGNKITATRTTTAGRSAARTFEKKTHLEQAGDSLDVLLQERAELEIECQREIEELKRRFSPENLELEVLELRCRKTDIKIDLLCLCWIPLRKNLEGDFATLSSSISSQLLRF
jgi:hypothetical protein